VNESEPLAEESTVAGGEALPSTSEALPAVAETLHVVALPGATLFPDVVLPLSVGRGRSVEAVRGAVQARRPLGVIMQRDPTVEDPSGSALHEVGTLAEIVRYLADAEGNHHVIVHGRRRFRVREWVSESPHLEARVEFLREPGELEERDTEVQARFVHLKDLVRQALELLPQAPEGLQTVLANTSSPAAFANLVATFVDLPPAEKQALLETEALLPRLIRLGVAVSRQMEILRLSRQIGEQTRGTLDQRQREVFLREQLKTIRKELGEDGEHEEIQQLREAIEKAGMPADVEKEARKELARLEQMTEASAEYGIIRTYLQWLLDLPWSKSSPTEIDIAAARRVLDEDHYGLDRIKRRILEFLAVRKLNPEGKSPILCFVGPPGVGKTSLGRSIARATGREFVRISLGGVHDEAEIRGHRRTYIGALPGNIVRSLVRAGTNNPVFMLDEIDKLSPSAQGDPAAALLEVLDPEQNSNFRDTYLALPIDLSKVMFIGTANAMEGIPGPLRDRCEVIELSGYTEDEKLHIAQRYLVARQRAENGLREEQLEITEPALRQIIRHYTREAGCRGLERQIGAVCRAVATRVAEGNGAPARIDAGDLREILGRPRFQSELALRTSLPGVATGLAWTPTGGSLLFIEASAVPGKGALVLTGQLGEVMRESAQAAITAVKARAGALGIEPGFFEKHDLHVHVPEGATPKDGPSAGIALYVALASLLTGRRARGDVAMTGEITLRGLVLPIGGVKEKVLAAHRAGIRTVLLPARNEPDLEDVPKGALAELRVIPVETVEDVLAQALENPLRPAH
jgi:ATP-dependent Lon protease